MNCQSVQSQMAARSAGLLSLAEETACERHCALCPACYHEWETFQDTLDLLACLSQPLPSCEASKQMWGICSEDWVMRVEMHRTKAPLWGAMRGWASQQPPWGWVALGGAILIFSSVWMMPPNGSNAPTVYAEVPAVNQWANVPVDGGPLLFMRDPQRDLPGNFQGDPRSAALSAVPGLPLTSPAPSTSRRVEFTMPSPLVSSAVNYHSSMSFDPFVDHVGTGLVSSSAAPAPLPTAVSPAATATPEVPVVPSSEPVAPVEAASSPAHSVP